MFNNYKNDILHLANTEAGRFLLSKLGQKPEYLIVDIGKDYFTEHIGDNKFRSTFYSKVPIKHLFAPIIDKVRFANEYKDYNYYRAFLNYSDLEPSPRFPQIYLTEGTFYPDADPESTTVDGRVIRGGVDETFAVIRAGAGTGADSTTANREMYHIRPSSTSNQYSYNMRNILLFDTSSLDDTAIISAAIFSLYITAVDNYLGGQSHDNSRMCLVPSTPASNTNLVNADYGQIGTTNYGESAKQDGLSTSAYNDITLNAAGIAAIPVDNVAKFGIRSKWDRDNTTTGLTWYTTSGTDAQDVEANQSDAGSNKPKLVVTYTVGGNLDLTSKSW